MKALNRFKSLMVIFGTAVTFCFAQTVSAQDTYIITGSGTQFTAAKGGSAIQPADEYLNMVIDAIKADAAGKPCVIQFGDGTDVVNIGTAGIEFDGGASGTDWGVITLTGKITSSLGNAASAAIVLNNGVSVNSTADIANTAAASGHGIRHNSTGTLTISGGTVSVADGVAIHNNSTGSINISGGTVEADTDSSCTVLNDSTGSINISGGTISTMFGTAIDNQSTGSINISGGTVFGNAVYNNSTGTVNISGGTVEAIVYNQSTGKITISGDALVTSESTQSDRGTIYLAESGAETAERLVIEGGTVENNAANIRARAIYNASTGAVRISGGTAAAATGYAVYNNSSGSLTINGGTVSAARGNAVHSNYSTCPVTISGGTVSAETGAAVLNGIVTVSGDALITSANPSTSSGIPATISAVKLIVEGGTVENTGTGDAIRNGDGQITISGGTVSAITGSAIYHYSTDRITISGDALITSANTNADRGTIYLSKSSLLAEGGTIENTAAGNAIYGGTQTINGGTVSAASGSAICGGSNLTINGGTISATTGSAVNSEYNITINGGTILAASGYAVRGGSNTTISGGTISAEDGTAVCNCGSYGILTISGGTISAADGYAVYDNSDVFSSTLFGKTIISGNALVTSKNTNAAQGTVYLAKRTNSAETVEVLAIEGGTIENTAAGNAIYNESLRALTVGSGKILAKEGYALYKENTDAAATLAGGFLFAYGTAAGSVIYGSYNRTPDNTVAIAAWNHAAGNTEYKALDNTDILTSPSAARAVWDKRNGISGIAYENGTNTGFIALDVTVTGGSTAVIFQTAAGVTHDPGKTLSQNAGSGAAVNGASGSFTAGPNPVVKSSGVIGFFWHGKGIEKNAALYIYDASGNFVRKIYISDKVMGNSERRRVGEWDLKDSKGRQASEGAYAVKGTITVNGRKEKVSLILGIR